MKIVFIILVLSILSSFNTFSKDTNIDSLKVVLAESASDEERLNILSQLGEELLILNPKEALAYSQQLSALAKRKKDHQWTTTAYHLEGRVNLNLGNIERADEIYNEALGFELKANPIDKTKLAWVEVNFGNHFKRTGRYQEAIEHFKHGLEVAKEIGDKTIQADCLVNTGAMFLYLGEMDSAGYYFAPAQSLAYAIHDTSTLQTVSVNMANVYEARGEYDKALDELKIAEFFSESDYDLAYVYGTRGNIYYYKGQLDSAILNLDLCKNYFKKSGRELEVGMVINSIAEILKDNGDYERAKQEFQKAEEIFTRLGNDDFLTGVVINSAGLHKDLGDLDSSYFYYQKALQLGQKINNPSHIGVAFQNLGMIDQERGDYATAAKFGKSLLLFEQIGDKRLIAEAHYAISSSFINLKSYSSADSHSKKALEAAKEIGHMELQIKSLDRYVEIRSLLDGNKELYDYHKMQMELMDSLRSIDNSNAAQELSVSYDLREKADSIKIQSLEITNQQKVNEQITIINNQRGTLLWISLTGGAILLMLALSLIVSRKKLSAKNKENETLLGEIHHRVKNNLQVISSLLSLQEKSITDITAKKAILEGKERVKSMGLIHKMLYQNDNYSGIEMNEYITKLVSGLMDSFGLAKGSIDFAIDSKQIKLDVDSAIPIGLIINELVINSFKYAFEKSKSPKISVRLIEENSSLKLSVSDNGDGKIESVENSTSFGNKLVKSLVRQINGKLTLEQIEGLSYTILIKDYKLV